MESVSSELSLSGNRISTDSDSALVTPTKQEQSAADKKLLDVEKILSTLPSTGVLGKRKRIPYTLVEANKGNKCPTEGCDGMGHITGLYAMHYAVSGCPLAHGKTPEECKVTSLFPSPFPPPLAPPPILTNYNYTQARREEMNRAKQTSGASAPAATSELEQEDNVPPRKTLRLQSSRNLSVSLENITGSTPILTPQMSRVSQPVNHQVPKTTPNPSVS